MLTSQPGEAILNRTQHSSFDTRGSKDYWLLTFYDSFVVVRFLRMSQEVVQQFVFLTKVIY